MADIAEMTGVSVPTVSKVVNGRKDVSAESRSRIEAAIREHGYQRSAGSRSRAPLVEVIFHELESEWALEIVRGVERVARRHHLAVVLGEMQGRWSPGRGWIDEVLARRPTGVISVFSDISDSMKAQLAARGIPYVVVDPTGEPHHDTPSIQPLPGVRRPCISLRTTARWLRPATRSTPRTISSAHSLSSS